jgi:hypothetical protein
VFNDGTTTRQKIVKNVDWVTVESEVPSQYMPNWGEGGDQEHLSPHQDLNPGNLEHKTVVLTTIFNANTVVPQSHRPYEKRSGLNHPQFCSILKKKPKYNTFKSKHCTKQFIIIIIIVVAKVKKSESELLC